MWVLNSPSHISSLCILQNSSYLILMICIDNSFVVENFLICHIQCLFSIFIARKILRCLKSFLFYFTFLTKFSSFHCHMGLIWRLSSSCSNWLLQRYLYPLNKSVGTNWCNTERGRKSRVIIHETVFPPLNYRHIIMDFVSV